MRYLCEQRDRPAPWAWCDSASFEYGRSATREYHAFGPIGAAEGPGLTELQAVKKEAMRRTAVVFKCIVAVPGSYRQRPDIQAEIRGLPRAGQGQ